MLPLPGALVLPLEDGLAGGGLLAFNLVNRSYHHRLPSVTIIAVNLTYHPFQLL